MTKAASAVLADALRLSEAARAELAAELLASLDGPPDPEAEPAWDAEISRRIAAIESGTMPLESWDDVKRRIAKDVLGRVAATARTGRWWPSALTSWRPPKHSSRHIPFVRWTPFTSRRRSCLRAG